MTCSSDSITPGKVKHESKICIGEERVYGKYIRLYISSSPSRYHSVCQIRNYEFIAREKLLKKLLSPAGPFSRLVNRDTYNLELDLDDRKRL